MEELYLIVGLGNPGAEYAGTRHNAGFRLAERLAERWGAAWSANKRFRCRIARAGRGGRKLLLCQPQTFMNGSGEAVSAVTGFYQVPASRLLVVVDDADLPLGEIRLRREGGTGGHHGLESVEQHLATRNYARLRIGIGRRADEVREITNHVLGTFLPAERDLLGKVLQRAADQVECWLSAGIEKAMSQYNGAVECPEPEKDN